MLRKDLSKEWAIFAGDGAAQATLPGPGSEPTCSLATPGQRLGQAVLLPLDTFA